MQNPSSPPYSPSPSSTLYWACNVETQIKSLKGVAEQITVALGDLKEAISELELKLEDGRPPTELNPLEETSSAEDPNPSKDLSVAERTANVVELVPYESAEVAIVSEESTFATAGHPPPMYDVNDVKISIGVGVYCINPGRFKERYGVVYLTNHVTNSIWFRLRGQKQKTRHCPHNLRVVPREDWW